MASNKTFECPVCHNPVNVPSLINVFVFLKDAQPTLDLLEGRTNTAVCPVCKTSTSVLTALGVLNPYEKELVVVTADDTERVDAAFQELIGAGYRQKVCHNYNELLQIVLPWLNPYIVPICQILLSDKMDQLTRQEQIDLITPLFLRIFRDQVGGLIPIHFELNGVKGSEQTEFVSRFYTATVCDQLERITLEASGAQRLWSLMETIPAHVPKECITSEVSSAVIRGCYPLADQIQDRYKFMIGFRQEYCNAVVHAYTNVPNPRGQIWASYIYAAWLLSKNEQFRLEPQCLLTPDSIRGTVKFGDLWNASLGGLSSKNWSEKQFSTSLEMMQHHGFEKELADAASGGVWRISFPPDFADRFLELQKQFLFETRQFNRTADESESFGPFVRDIVLTLVQNSQQQTALRLVDDLLHQALEVGDRVAAVAIAGHAGETFNKFSMFHESQSLLSQVINTVGDHPEVFPPSSMIYFWNEVGNTYRYAGYYESALEAYQYAARWLEVTPDAEDYESNKSVAQRNMAIVYRNMGQFKKAMDILQAEAKRDPSDHALQNSLATLYAEVNRYQDALHSLDRAIELLGGRMTANPYWSVYRLNRGWFKQMLGEHEAGLQDLMEAFHELPKDALLMQARIGAAAMSFYPQSRAGKDFVQQCRDLIVDLLKQDEFPGDPSLLLSLLGQLSSRLLRDGHIQETESLLAPFRNWIEEEQESMPWEIFYILGWLLHAQGRSADCWPFIELALFKLEWDVPAGEETSFALFWIQNKSTFQELLATVALDLVGRGALPPHTLLTVYEFMNGREIIARMLSVEEEISPVYDQAILERYRKGVSTFGREVESFFFVETRDTIRLANLSSTRGTVTLIDISLGTGDMGILKRQFTAALKNANPADLSMLDRKLEAWNQAACQIGAAIAPYLIPAVHVCFLPGRTMTGLPLHLITLPHGERMIEAHTISYAPNFTTLLAAKPGDDSPSLNVRTVVTVTKERDTPDFKQRALETSEQIVEILRETGETTWLKQEHADHTAVGEALHLSTEIAFVCHGTTAGHEKGHGICVADTGSLPPSVLSVAEFPDHSRFILTWEDIDRSPEIVVSIACSSGVVTVAGGGVRLGLEQTLFSKGTRIVISPLWDVEQSFSLGWLEDFYRTRSAHPDWTIEHVFQGTCVERMRQGSHFYFWGSFMINGSLNT